MVYKIYLIYLVEDLSLLIIFFICCAIKWFLGQLHTNSINYCTARRTTLCWTGINLRIIILKTRPWGEHLDYLTQQEKIYFHYLLGTVINDDVIKWKHFPRYWPFVQGIHRSPVNSPYKGQWHGALIFCLICVWINGWVSNGEAGDLRR